jgi:hypothetical protein
VSTFAVWKDTMANFGTQLLRWVSERGSGSWTELSGVISHLRTARHGEFRQRNLDPVKFRPSQIAAYLAALGHIDIDWRQGRWSVARPTMNVIPGLGLCVVLTGSRTAELEKRLEKAADILDVYPFSVDQFPMPAASFLKCSSLETAKEVAKRFEADLIFNPSRTLVNCMCRIDELPLELVPEPRHEDAKMYTPAGRYDWSDATQFVDGLYRIDLSGRVQFRLRRSNGDEVKWYDIERATGQLLILNSLGRKVVRHTVTTEVGHGVFAVEERVSLPIGVERALTLCSGSTAVVSRGERQYDNVPRELAQQIMTLILQD